MTRVQLEFCWGLAVVLAKVWLGFCCGFALVLLGLCFGLGSSLAGFLLWFCWVGVAASDQGGAGPHPCNFVWF